MVSAASLLGFAAAAAVIVVVPGLDQALLLRASTAGGHRAALATAGGIITGITLWGTATVLGLAALLTRSETAFLTLTVAGACYLMWIGTTSIHQAVRPAEAADADAAANWHRHFFRRGLVVNLLNPKIGLFYLSILPIFLPPASHSVLGAEILLCGIYVTESTLWLFGFALAAGSLHKVLSRPRVRRFMNGAVGVVLIGLGATVLAGELPLVAAG